MENMSTGEVWAAILAAASAIVLLSNAAKAIAAAWSAAKAPNDQQNERLDDLEQRMSKVETKLSNDQQQLDDIHKALRASTQAQLALLDHGIDGNNIKQMQDAKEVLQQYLINR
jgi:exonuclease VII large subunit